MFKNGKIMGIGSNWAVEVAEEKYREAKEEWIREMLNDPNADEDTAGWDELSDAYDERPLLMITTMTTGLFRANQELKYMKRQ